MSKSTQNIVIDLEAPKNLDEWEKLDDLETEKSNFVQEDHWEKMERTIDNTTKNNQSRLMNTTDYSSQSLMLTNTSLEISTSKQLNNEQTIDKSRATTINRKFSKLSYQEKPADMFYWEEKANYTLDTAPLSPDATFDLFKLDPNLQSSVNDNDFWKFAEIYLRKRSKWGKIIPIETILSHSTRMIDKSLTHVDQDMNYIVIQSFKNILSYTCERSSGKPGIGHIKKLVTCGMSHRYEIRDEIYMQIIKQTRNNPNNDKLLKVWKLFGIMASVFPPSGNMFYPLLNYLMSVINSNNETNDVKAYANFGFVRLFRIYKDEPRIHEPTVDEILYIEARKQIMLPIYFLTGFKTYIPIESYTTSTELRESIIKKLDIEEKKLPYLGLYEVCDKKEHLEERFIESNERIADILAQWESEIRANVSEKLEFKIYLRLRIFPNFTDTQDIDLNTFIYTHLVYEITHGRYYITENDIITLAALQMQAEYGDYNIENVVLETKLNKCIASNKIDDMPLEFWIEKISNAWKLLKSMDKYKAKLEYITYCKSFPLCFSTQFGARYAKRSEEEISSIDYPEDVIIGINPDSVIICDAGTRKVINKVPLFKLITWGISTEYFVIVTGDDHVQEKNYFETTHALQMDYLLQSYTRIALDEDIPLTLSTIKKNQQTKKKKLARNCVSFHKKF